MERRKKQAVALEYDATRHGAPQVTAKGRGVVAEEIVRRAVESGVPVREDAALTEMLGALEIGEEIPPELYLAVAEILAWVYRLEKR